MTNILRIITPVEEHSIEGIYSAVRHVFKKFPKNNIIREYFGEIGYEVEYDKIPLYVNDFQTEYISYGDYDEDKKIIEKTKDNLKKMGINFLEVFIRRGVR